MKKCIFIILALFIASCGNQQTAGIPSGISGGSVSQTAASGASDVTAALILSRMKNAVYKEGELLVKFRRGVSSSASTVTHQSAGASVEKSFDLISGLQLVRLPEGLSVRDAVTLYMSDPNVEYAEPNYIRHVSTLTPNDTYFYPQQWPLENTGDYAGGSEDADIDAPEAWSISTGDRSIVIAIIDTGIDYNHSDLAQNMWLNTGETDCADGIDNDDNGYIDDCRGWDFTTCEAFCETPDQEGCEDLCESQDEEGCEIYICLTAKEEGNDPFDDYGHGTHVAGIAGATGNNSEGVTGVMWTASLMALKAFNADGAASDADIINAINYATSNGANIMNASFGGYQYSAAMYDAIQAAAIQGVLFVASAGNGGFDGIGDNNDAVPSYPASYDLPNVIAVAATDQNDERVSFSNYGLQSVDVAAPGVYIWSTLPNWYSLSINYGIIDTWAGTSMAAPHVAGLAGLLMSYYDGLHNTKFDYFQVKRTIMNFSDRLASLEGWVASSGRINAYKSLASLETPSDLTATANPVAWLPSVRAYEDPTITLKWNDNATGEETYLIERRVPGGTFVEHAWLPANTENYQDTGLATTTLYTYRVTAYNDIAASFRSSEAAALTADFPGSSSGCSIVAGQRTPVDIVLLLIPAVAFIVSVATRRRR